MLLSAHCPRYPDIERREGFDHAYSYEGGLSHIKAEETCSARGGFLPLSSYDMVTDDLVEDVHKFKAYTIIVTGEFVLRVPPNSMDVFLSKSELIPCF